MLPLNHGIFELHNEKKLFAAQLAHPAKLAALPAAQRATLSEASARASSTSAPLSGGRRAECLPIRAPAVDLLEDGISLCLEIREKVFPLKRRNVCR